MKKILISVIALFMFVPFINVEARTVQDMYDELAELKEQRDSANSNKQLTQSQINTLNNEINTATANIAKTQEEIKEANKSIEESNIKIAEKTEETKELLRFLQVTSGENVYLEYLFEAEDYTEFIYRFAIISQLSEYNNNLMNELEALIEELELKKIELAKKEVALEEERQTLTSKVNTLRANLRDLEALGTSIEEDIADLQGEIDYYVNTLKCGINQDISSCSNMPYAHGFSYPLAWGCVTSEYTGYNQRTDWSGGGGHHGIDLDCVGEGTNVYAAAPGVVARVVRYQDSLNSSGYSCGGNMIYIYHTVNGKNYTTVYMHLLSINVSYGQTVTADTIIAKMGGGASTWWDSCSTGAHLHFGMAEGHNAYNFNSYSFNPRSIYSFPDLIYDYTSYRYFYR